MALGDVIARLAVNLSLETAAFEKGATKTEKRLNQMKGRFADFGKGLAASTAVISGAILGVNKVLGDLSDRSKELDIAAQVSGESYERFQRLAYGAKSVGIEAEKLGDIFKDVRERVGEFVVTGGGPLQDAFDALNGKVGLTVDELRGLSGKDALQLITTRMEEAKLSTEEMSFVLESLGSDATALLPLLRNGGAAWEEYAKKAAVISEEQRDKLRTYDDAINELDNSFQQLKLTLVDGGVIDEISQFSKDLASLVGGLTGVEAATSDATEELDENAKAAQEADEKWRSLGKSVRETGLWIDNWWKEHEAANQKRATNSRKFWRDLWSGIEEFNQRMIDGANAITGSISSVFSDFNQRTIDWANSIKAAVADMARQVGVFAQQIYTSVKTWLQDKLGGVFDWVRGKVQAVEQSFAWLYDRVVGNSWIPDMVDEIGQNMDKLQTLMVDPALKATQKTDEAFRTLASNVSSLLDRLFPEVARLREMYSDLDMIDAGVSAGILSGDVAQEARTRIRGEARGTGRAEPRMFDKPMATIDLGKTMEKTIDSLSKKIGLMGEQSKLTTVKIAESFKDMVSKSVSALNDFASAIKGGGFLDILSSAVDLFLQLGSTGLFGKKLAANINRTPGYANGTNFHPGGLAMVGERGPELVSMPRGSKVFTNRETMGMIGAGGGITINVNAKDAVLTSAVKGWVAEGVAIATQGGAQLAGQQAQFHRSRRVA